MKKSSCTRCEGLRWRGIEDRLCPAQKERRARNRHADRCPDCGASRRTLRCRSARRAFSVNDIVDARGPAKPLARAGPATSPSHALVVGHEVENDVRIDEGHSGSSRRRAMSCIGRQCPGPAEAARCGKLAWRPCGHRAFSITHHHRRRDGTATRLPGAHVQFGAGRFWHLRRTVVPWLSSDGNTDFTIW